MTNRNQALLRIPQGTERFSLDEAYRNRRLVHRIEDFYQRWGYLPAQTPVVDFFDVYDPLLTPNDRRDIYRLIDRDGEVLLLRSDVTLFLAKQMGLLLREEDLPERVYYSDAILRHQQAYDISRNEFFQTGVELIGMPGTAGEVEVLVLLFELLDAIGSPPHACHIGSRRLLDAALLSGAPDVVVAPAVRRAVSLRRFESLGSLIGPERTAKRASLFELILDGTEFVDRAESLRNGLDDEEATALDGITSVVRALLNLGYGERFRVDLSEIGNQPYHSGIAFRTYVDGVDSAVAAGGRYDGLLGRFGFDVASVGFSVMLRKLEPLLASTYTRPEATQIEANPEVSERLRKAREIVRSGGRVSL